MGHTSPRRRSRTTQASAAIQHAMTLQNTADGPDAGQLEQSPLGAQRVGNGLRPVKSQRAGRGQPLSAGQHRQLHLRGRAIVDSSWGSGVGAPVYLIEWVRASPSEPPLQRRKRPPRTRSLLAVGVGLGELPRPCFADGREAFFFIMSSPPIWEEYSS